MGNKLHDSISANNRIDRMDRRRPTIAWQIRHRLLIFVKQHVFSRVLAVRQQHKLNNTHPSDYYQQLPNSNPILEPVLDPERQVHVSHGPEQHFKSLRKTIRPVCSDLLHKPRGIRVGVLHVGRCIVGGDQVKWCTYDVFLQMWDSQLCQMPMDQPLSGLWGWIRADIQRHMRLRTRNIEPFRHMYKLLNKQLPIMLEPGCVLKLWRWLLTSSRKPHMRMPITEEHQLHNKQVCHMCCYRLLQVLGGWCVWLVCVGFFGGLE